MNDLKTLLGSKIHTSVNVNGLFVPANSFSSHIRQFSEPAVFATEGFDPYTMSLGGSMTKVKVRQRYFTLLTRHQIDKGKFDFHQVSVLNQEDREMITAERAIFQTFNAPHDLDFDCVACEFTTPIREKLLSRNGWYQIDQELCRETTPKPLLVCAIGYPGYRNFIDFDSMHYGISPNAIFGREAQPSIRGRLSFEPIDPLKYDPEGLSGAPVFGVNLDKSELNAFLAGIVSEASKTKVHFISLRTIRTLLWKMEHERP